MSLKLHNAMWRGSLVRATKRPGAAGGLEDMLKLTAAADVTARSLTASTTSCSCRTHQSGSQRRKNSVRSPIRSPASVSTSVRWLLPSGRERLAIPRWAMMKLAGFLGSQDGLPPTPVFREPASGSAASSASTQPSSVSRSSGKIPRRNTTKIAKHIPRGCEDRRRQRPAISLRKAEICWASMHSWKDILRPARKVGMPETLSFQADMAHLTSI